MAGTSVLSPERASAMGKVGGCAAQARPDAAQQLAAARASFLRQFETQVDPKGELEPGLRQRLAAQARRVYFASLIARRWSRARRDAVAEPTMSEAAGV